jgi:hypothetical protein
MQTLGLTTEQFIEVISLYSAPQTPIAAVAAEPGWFVIGGFFMPASATIRLDLIGSVSDDSLTLSTRLYCVTDGFAGVVGGSLVSLATVVDTRQLSSAFTLEGGRLYQVQAQVVGDAGDDFFGYVRRLTPAGA